MNMFKQYAQFYDTIYQDKNYKKECYFLEKIFKKFSKRKVKTILDLGCGTASHDVILAKRGYNITGVDMSYEMIKIAKNKIKQENLDIRLCQGNIQTIRLRRKFDAVISMFDVMGYQTTNEAFENALTTAEVHLKNGGLFIFDIWFGPAVLKNKPGDKVKTVYSADGGKVIRYSKCKIDILKEVVNIRFITEKYYNGKLIYRNKEYHKMRFFFFNEIRGLLAKTGFKLKTLSPFLKLKETITENDWTIIIISEKVST